MKEVRCKLYKFEELSDKVKKELIEKNRWEVAYDVMDIQGDEYEFTLKAFENLFGIKVHYEVDYCGCNWSVEDFYPIGEYCNEISAKELKGKYILRVINSFYNDLFPFKRYWGEFKWDENRNSLTKTRYSKILRNYEGCPLTGVIYDITILQPIMDFLKKPNMEISLMDLVRDCLSRFFDQWYKDYEYWCDNTDNCLEEELENLFENDYFFEDGRIFNGIIEDAA